MPEKLKVETQQETKSDTYNLLLKQSKALVEGEADLIANMANITSLVHEAFGFWWTGFYLVKDDELVLGPFQGPVACTRIQRAKGVCGTSWDQSQTIIVPNVHEFPGHIACSAESNSEIVVPVWRDDKIIAVLDIDSKAYNTFDEEDKFYLEQIVELLA